MLSCSVLVLNRHFQPVHVTNAKRAFSLLYLGVARALDREFRTFDFDTWAQLSAEQGDDVVHTINRVIRVPRVIVLQIYDRIPKTKVRFSRHNIYMRDGEHLPVLPADPAAHRSEPGPRGAARPGRPHHLGERRLLLHRLQPDQGRPHARSGRHAPAARRPIRPRWTPTFRAAGDKIRYREWIPFLDIPNASYWNVELKDD